jgi:hypothetical protein
MPPNKQEEANTGQLCKLYSVQPLWRVRYRHGLTHVEREANVPHFSCRSKRFLRLWMRVSGLNEAVTTQRVISVPMPR